MDEEAHFPVLLMWGPVCPQHQRQHHPSHHKHLTAAPAALTLIPTMQQPSHETGLRFPTYWTQETLVTAEQTSPHRRPWRASTRQEKRQKINVREGARKGKIDGEYSDVWPRARTCAPVSMASQIMSWRIWMVRRAFPTPITCWVIRVQFYF